MAVQLLQVARARRLSTLACVHPLDLGSDSYFFAGFLFRPVRLLLVKNLPLFVIFPLNFLHFLERFRSYIS